MSRLFNSVLTESPLGSPFVPVRRFVLDPAVANLIGNLGGSLISGLGSLFGGSSQASAIRESNEKNYLIAKENRAWQEQENAKARQFQKDMWNEQNKYNTPANQRRLAQEGGYNPYLLSTESLGSGAGSAGVPGMQGAPNSPQMQPVNPLQGLSAFGSELGRGSAAFASLFQQGLQIESNVDLQRMKSLETVSDIMLKLYKDGGQKQVDEFMKDFAPTLKALDFSGSFYEKRMQKEFLKMDIENDRADLERSLIEKFGEQEAQKKLRAFDDEHNRVRAEINKMISEKKLNLKRVEELGSEMARNFASARLFGSQAGQIEVLLPYLRAVAEDDSLRSFMDYEDKYAEYIMNSGKREQQKKPHSQSMSGWEEASRNNFVTAFIRGAASALPGLPPIINNKTFSPQFKYDYGTKYQYINPSGQ